MNRKSFRKYRWLWLILTILITTIPVTALAHPLGNFTVNQYSRLDVGSAGITVLYILDMAEIPTVQERQLIDRDNDKQLTKSEQEAYATTKAQELQKGLQLTLDNKPTELKLLSQDLTFLAGEGGLPTLRLTLRLETTALPRDAAKLDYRDTNYPGRIGWKEMVLRPANGAAVLNSSVPAVDQSNGLRGYPVDMLQSPLLVTEAHASFKIDLSIKVDTASDTAQAAPVVVKKPLDFFTTLFSEQALTVPVVLLALVVAFGLGTLHAFSPGHGKTVVGAYLIGSRSSAKHALFLGATVTITHTIGVFALGLLTLLASQYIVPEKFYPWLSLFSGGMVLLLGLSLLWNRTRFAFNGAGSTTKKFSYSPVDHQHDHDHSHDEHEHEHDHDGHSHNHHAHEHGDHSHDEPHENTHADHNHDGHSHDHSHDEPDEHKEHDHSHDEHSHGGIKHSHLPPGSDGSKVSWKSLLFFGISAGLLPCPSALVLMLSTIALNMTAFGLILVVFFSLGLAATLTGIGLLLIYARKLVTKLQLGVPSLLIRLIPVGAALLITGVGLLISYDALIQLQTSILNR